MAFMNIFDVDVVREIWEFAPLDDITIRVLHRNHAMQREEDEYILMVPIGTMLGEIKEKLLDTEFRNFGLLHDELMLWERARKHIELSDNDDFEDATTLCLLLVNKQEVSDEEEESGDETEIDDD